jgi:hypothetical protein
MDLAQTLQQFPQLVIAPPKREKDTPILDSSGWESIPELLFILVQHGLHGVRAGPTRVCLRCTSAE